MMGIAVIVSVFVNILGTYISFHLDVSTGGAIVVLQTLLFLSAFIFAPKHGLLARYSASHTGL
jgi:manganese transport system permease protein